MLIYILNNETLAISASDDLTIQYDGLTYELTENPMNGALEFSTEDAEYNVIGLVEEHGGKMVRIYAENEEEYDYIIETVSVTEAEDLEGSYFIHLPTETPYFLTKEGKYGYYTTNGIYREQDTREAMINHLDHVNDL